MKFIKNLLNKILKINIYYNNENVKDFIISNKNFDNTNIQFKYENPHIESEEIEKKYLKMKWRYSINVRSYEKKLWWWIS